MIAAAALVRSLLLLLLTGTAASLALQYNKYKNLLHWLREVPDCYVSPKLDIRPSCVDKSSSGYGVFATESISNNETLLIVPPHACISLTTATNCDKDFFNALGDRFEKAGPGGSIVCLAGWLAKEHVFLQLFNRSASSFYQPYLSTFPWSEKDQPHVLFWTPDKMKMLENINPQAAIEAEGLRSEVDLAKKVFRPILVSCVKKYPKSLWKIIQYDLPWSNNNKELEEIVDLAVTGAFVILLSRCFCSNSDSEESLVPVLDMMQHSSKDPTIRHFTESNGNVNVRASCDIEKGQELFNRYHNEGVLQPNQWLTRFGFIPDEDISDVDNVRSLKNLLQQTELQQ